MTIKLTKPFILDVLLSTSRSITNLPITRSSQDNILWLDFLNKDVILFQVHLNRYDSSDISLRKKTIDYDTLYQIANILDSRYGKDIHTKIS